MAKFTPGPWFIFEGTLCVGGPFVPGSSSGPDRDTGGVAHCGMRVRTSEEALANARLITQAPELLERLTQLIALVENDSDNTPGTELYSELMLAREVIKAATED